MIPYAKIFLTWPQIAFSVFDLLLVNIKSASLRENRLYMFVLLFSFNISQHLL